MSVKQKEQVDFGFKNVEKGDKATLVKGVFKSVAGKYDVMNDFMSVGVHRLWKDKMVSMISLGDGGAMLDLAGGTGDIGFRVVEKCRKKNVKAEIVTTDVNEHMLEEGRRRSVDRNFFNDVSWKQVDAENIPFPDDYFDYVTISFGIRNVTDKDKALREIYRVLKPTGRFLCLEFSNVNNPLLSKIYDFHSFNVIPKVGGLVTGDSESYQYLVESIRKFPNRKNFAKMIEDAGFENVTAQALTGGIVAIHSGWKV